MTTQVPDTLQLEGRTYVILNWQGDTDCIPSSESLGFHTVSQSSENWSGRINHYGVWGNELYLFKIEATLEAAPDTPTPPNARREVLLRYEQFFDFEGHPAELREYRYDFFIYEDLKLPFTGRVIAVAEENLWGKPEAALDAEPATPFAIVFRNGLVEDVYDLE
ncbi:hypothetical protein [Stutzerimonas nitrititolerans]|uniref:hypothetical protein n=1 Tax=Stutzerimonas nitrititolerans TaxID=2482751 RepID=UPI0028980DAC|nr:hypothetical protein [Stutzerimonas nitrititolerans]